MNEEYWQSEARRYASNADYWREQLAAAHAAIRRQHGLIEQLWRYAAHRRGCARVMLIEVDKEPPCDCGFDEICAVLDAHNKTHAPVIRRAMGEGT